MRHCSECNKTREMDRRASAMPVCSCGQERQQKYRVWTGGEAAGFVSVSLFSRGFPVRTSTALVPLLFDGRESSGGKVTAGRMLR